MATPSLAVVALAGTALLALIELVARLASARATRHDPSTLVVSLALAGGSSLVVAAIATVRVTATVALLASGVMCVALVGAALVRVASVASRS